MIPADHMPAATEISDAPETGSQAFARHALLCAALIAFPLILAWDSMRLVVALALQNETYTHIPLIPLVSAFLIYTERRTIFSRISFNWSNGLILLALGAAAILAARINPFHLRPANQMSLIFLGLVTGWIGGFAISWGPHALKSARFALLFLLFMVPIPEPFLSHFITFLQEWSANSAAAFFSLFGVPFLREHLIFSLPGIAIRVAEECSGIRSALALMIMTVLACHLFLKTGWKKLVVCLLVIPLSILKNGLRIATLSTLAVYVDDSFLTGSIHHQFGGMVFFGVAFIPLIALFLYFQRTEARKLA